MAKRFHLSMPLCALRHSGSHLSHGLTSPSHIDEGYITYLKTAKVPPQCRHVLQSTWSARPMHAATIQTGDDMPAGLASLTQFLCCAYMSVHFVSYTVA